MDNLDLDLEDNDSEDDSNFADESENDLDSYYCSLAYQSLFLQFYFLHAT